jgi:hypothetical protein
MNKPHILTLPEVHGKHAQIAIIEGPLLSLLIKRVYWIYNPVPGSVGGNHAHLSADRIIVCTRGKAAFQIEDQRGERHEFILDHPTKALYFPKLHWINYQMDQDAMLMVLTDTMHKDDVKISDYANFRNQTSPI